MHDIFVAYAVEELNLPASLPASGLTGSGLSSFGWLFSGSCLEPLDAAASFLTVLFRGFALGFITLLSSASLALLVGFLVRADVRTVVAAGFFSDSIFGKEECGREPDGNKTAEAAEEEESL